MRGFVWGFPLDLACGKSTQLSPIQGSGRNQKVVSQWPVWEVLWERSKERSTKVFSEDMG
jgi:hypothetical protein